MAAMRSVPSLVRTMSSAAWRCDLSTPCHAPETCIWPRPTMAMRSVDETRLARGHHGHRIPRGPGVPLASSRNHPSAGGGRAQASGARLPVHHLLQRHAVPGDREGGRRVLERLGHGSSSARSRRAAGRCTPTAATSSRPPRSPAASCACSGAEVVVSPSASCVGRIVRERRRWALGVPRVYELTEFLVDGWGSRTWAPPSRTG